MNTSTLIPSQNEGLLPVLFGSNDMKKEESPYTPYEVVNEPVRKDKRRKHFIEANTEPIDMKRLKSVQQGQRDDNISSCIYRNGIQGSE